MSQLIDSVLNLSGSAAYITVALVAFGEAAAFVGLVLPGELAVLLGGVVVSAGHASLAPMLLAANVAAVAGDSVGYEVGRHFGQRILGWAPFQQRFGRHVRRASRYLSEKGGRAVLLGRWTALLRALIPGLAGIAGMPYPRFLLFNVLGGVAWATTFVLLGYFAGTSWQVVDRIVGRASLVLLLLIAIMFLIRVLTRRAVAHADRIRARLRDAADARPARWLRRRLDPIVDWLVARATPGTRRGLGWSATVVVAGAGAWLVGIAVQDLLAGDELALLDRPVAAWVGAHTTPPAVTVAGGVADALSLPAGLWLLAAAVLLGWRTSDRMQTLQVSLAGLIAGGLGGILQILLPTTTVGTRFPATSVTFVAALVTGTVAIAARRRFDLAIRIAGAGLALMVVAGVAELVSGRAALTGVVGGAGLGSLIGAAGQLLARLERPSVPGEA